MAQSWVYIGQAAKHFGVSVPTMRRWADTGQITSRRTTSQFRQFLITPEPIKETTRSNFIYVRVSSCKQTDDLERQALYLSQKFPHHQIIKDIGSGLNWKRKGLLSLLEQVQQDAVGEIVVASRDRLCRFGFELIQWLCQGHQTSIMVLESTNSTPEQELSKDILDIIQIFCCRRNGQRRYYNQKPKNTN